MDTNKSSDAAAPARAELIIAGLGGMGVLVAARLLAAAALDTYRHVSWMPTYGEARRGGLCDCTVILSQEEIASPILDLSGTIMLLDSSQVKTFEQRVRPGGLLILEHASLKERPARSDINIISLAGMEMAMGMGNLQAANLIMLGAYLELAGPIPPARAEDELRRRYTGAALERNLRAFQAGRETGGIVAQGRTNGWERLDA